jgi:hypothetical protein
MVVTVVAMICLLLFLLLTYVICISKSEY